MGRDDAGFAAFAAAQARPLMKTALALTHDFHAAQDLVQEALARMFESWDRLAEVDRPEAYVHVVLVRHYISQRRRRSFWERPFGDPPDSLSYPDDPALRVTIADALSALPAPDRAVLVLRYMLDRSVAEVAADLGKSPAAVRTQAKRALDRLRAAMNGEALGDLARQ